MTSFQPARARDAMRHAPQSPVATAFAVGFMLWWSIAGPSATAQAAPPAKNPFPGRFPAPSLDGGTEWLNTSGPIELKDLRGKLVLLDFWTFCCINCMHILPDLKYLEQKYGNQLVVIGVHAAKFENEKDSEKIRQAILRYEIEHPVVNDSELTIARKYQFQSWPTLVLIDPEGNVVGAQPGEGSRELFDDVIGKLVTYHRAKGTLDEKPMSFHLERTNQAPTPLRFPGKILVDAPSDRVFIADSNHNRIVIASLSGELQEVIGTGAIGFKSSGYADSTFDHPQGLCLVGETLYVADTENHLLREIDLQAKIVKTLAGTGQQARLRVPGGPLRKTPLNSPWALTHLRGVLYIAMAGPHQLWKHVIGKGTIEPFAGSGREDILDGSLTEAALAQPSAIVHDGESLYWVDSEGSAVRQLSFKPRPSIVTIAGPHDFPNGRSLFEFGDIDGRGDAVRLQHPIGLTLQGNRLFIADTYNDKIKTLALDTREVSTWIGTGEPGVSLDPLQLGEPAGLSATDTELFIADTNNHRILRVDLQTKQAREFVVAGLTPPSPPARSGPEKYTGPKEALSALTVQGAELALAIDFALPDGFKLNPLYEVNVRVASRENAGLVAESALQDRLQGEDAVSATRIVVPLTGRPSSDVLTLTVSFQYCREGQGAICRPGQYQFEVPVTVADSGESTLSLKIPVTP